VDVLAPPVGLSGCASGWPSCTIPYLGLGSQGNNGALLSSASLPDFLLVYLLLLSKAFSHEYPLYFSITTLLRVCPIPFFLFSQLAFTLFYFTN
jgi:hypothetical protein